MHKHNNPPAPEEMASALEKRRDERFNKVRRCHRIVMIVLLAVMAPLSVRNWNQPIVLTPDYQQTDKEPNAFQSHDNEEKFDVPEGGGAVALMYSDQVVYNLSTGRVSLNYTNPSSSTASIILQVVLHGPDGAEYLLAQSGRLDPGYGVERLDNDITANIVLQPGGYSGVMRLLFYNPVTGEKAIVDTEIPVTITVQ